MLGFIVLFFIMVPFVVEVVSYLNGTEAMTAVYNWYGGKPYTPVNCFKSRAEYESRQEYNRIAREKAGF